MAYFEQFRSPTSAVRTPRPPAQRVDGGQAVTWGECLENMAEQKASLEALAPVPAGLLAVFSVPREKLKTSSNWGRPC